MTSMQQGVTAAPPGPSTVPATRQGLDEDLCECLEKSWEGYTEAPPCRGAHWMDRAGTTLCAQTSCSGPGSPQVTPANDLAW